MTTQRTADGSYTLYSADYAQTFHSDRGALTESRHVFLGASGVGARLSAGKGCRVLEVGFGTGLNFFLSADLATANGAELAYCALERTLLSGDSVRGLDFARHLKRPELLEAFLSFRDSLPERVGEGSYQFRCQGVRLELLVGDATRQALPAAHFDAVYQDAFSPDSNPELWTKAFLQTLARALKPGGALSTYSVKGEVRRRLSALGLEVRKQPGPPGGKREMLLARRLVKP